MTDCYRYTDPTQDNPYIVVDILECSSPDMTLSTASEYVQLLSGQQDGDNSGTFPASASCGYFDGSGFQGFPLTTQECVSNDLFVWDTPESYFSLPGHTVEPDETEGPAQEYLGIDVLLAAGAFMLGFSTLVFMSFVGFKIKVAKSLVRKI